MKKIKILLVVLFLCLGMATMGWCLSIFGGPFDGDDVGTIDTLLAWTHKADLPGPGGGMESETAWVNSVLNPDDTATWYAKIGPDVPSYATTDDGVNARDGVYAINMPIPPESEYFIVKNSTYHALFANLALMEWGVFDMNADGLPDMNLGDITVSHVSRFDGAAPVPEPSTILLLGMGLFGLVAAGKKRVFKK